MGNNPITTGGCIAIAKALNESDNSVLCALYLTVCGRLNCHYQCHQCYPSLPSPSSSSSLLLSLLSSSSLSPPLSSSSSSSSLSSSSSSSSLSSSLSASSFSFSVAAEVNLSFLFYQDIPVEYEFKKLVEQIQKKRSFRVLHGTVLRSGNTSDDINKAQVNPNPKQNPLVVLREHIVINDTRIVDILRQYDPQETYSVTTDHFALALKVLSTNYN